MNDKVVNILKKNSSRINEKGVKTEKMKKNTFPLLEMLIKLQQNYSISSVQLDQRQLFQIQNKMLTITSSQICVSATQVVNTQQKQKCASFMIAI